MSVQTYCVAVFVILCCVFPQFVRACDNPPVAVDDAIRTQEQLVVLIDPLANDSDPQGLPLVVAIVSSTCPGSTTTDGDLIVLTLATVLTSTCQITYSIDNGVTTAATATVSVLPGAPFFQDSFESGNLSSWF